MRGVATAGRRQCGFTFVSYRRTQQRRLSDDAELRPVSPGRHVVDERANSHTAELFVVRESQLQRNPQLALGGELRGSQGACDESFMSAAPRA